MIIGYSNRTLISIAHNIEFGFHQIVDFSTRGSAKKVFVNGVTYSSLESHELSWRITKNPYIGYCYKSTTAIVASLLIFPAIYKLGRRWPTFCLYLVGEVCLLASIVAVIYNNHPALVIIRAPYYYLRSLYDDVEHSITSLFENSMISFIRILYHFANMDVTKDNFEEAFNEICDAFDNACFIALDTEFTSLQAHLKNQKPTITDSLEEDYSNYIQKSKDTRILQVGLCVFQFDGNHSFTARPFNFNLFPETIFETTGNSPYLADTFACQISSIRFLAGYGFDFTKCFRDGIPYINFNQEMKIKNALLDEYLQDDLLQTIRAYMLSSDERDPLSLWLPSDRTPAFVNIYLQDRFPGIIIDSCLSHNIRISKQNAAVNEENELVCFEKILNRISGFRRVFVEMIRRKIPIVGHNCFADILLMFQCFHQELPDGIVSFIRSVHNDLFHQLWDTKYIIKSLKSKMPNLFQGTPTSLSQLYDHLKLISLKNTDSNLQLSTISIPSKFSRYLSSASEGKDNDLLPNMIETHAAHEAGYDAWMTGVCLIRMIDILLTSKLTDSHEYDRLMATFNSYRQALSLYDNFVNLINGSAPFVNFSESDIAKLPIIPSYVYSITGVNNYSFIRSIIRHIDMCEVDPSQNVVMVRGEHSRNYLEKALSADEVICRGITFRQQSNYIRHLTRSTCKIFPFWLQQRNTIMIGSGLLAVCFGIGLCVRIS
ncbi:hypothetical protein GJ496_001638 [Pomphorhynchus laevis]|nr:hypothetical protein GJ496_001638 [Pomphorhynchus laevis]